MTDTQSGRHTSRGILWFMLAIGLLATMDAFAKWLVTHDIHAVQILALRSVVITPLLLLAFALRRQLHQLVPTRPVAQGVRGILGFAAPACFFLSILYIPLTTATIMFFSSTFFICLLSVVFLHERIGLHRWASVIIGYVGVLIVLSPSLMKNADDAMTGAGSGTLAGLLLALIGGLTYAGLFISGRYLSQTESTPSLVMSYNLGVGVVGLLLLPWFWSPLSVADVTLLLMLSLFAVGGHFAITHAFSVSEASLIAPFEYSALLWTVLYDTFIWQELPDAATWAGAIVIIASGLYVTYRERIQSRGASLARPH